MDSGAVPDGVTLGELRQISKEMADSTPLVKPGRGDHPVWKVFPCKGTVRNGHWYLNSGYHRTDEEFASHWGMDVKDLVEVLAIQ